MKKEEIIALTDIKLNEGKDYKEIKEEIRKLKQSQIIFKNKELELKQLNKKLLIISKERDNLKKELFKLKFERDINKTKEKENKIKELEESNDGDIKHIRRIKLLIEETEEPLTISKIKEVCCINTKKILSCLKLLEDYKLIDSVKGNKGIKRWFIKK